VRLRQDAGAAGARLRGWRPNHDERRGGGRGGAICSAELMPTWHFCLCSRVSWAPRRQTQEATGTPTDSISIRISRCLWCDAAVEPDATAGRRRLPSFLRAHEGATSPCAVRTLPSRGNATAAALDPSSISRRKPCSRVRLGPAGTTWSRRAQNHLPRIRKPKVTILNETQVQPR
jgi:hypothetical protein